jgi:hypothetical protein
MINNYLFEGDQNQDFTHEQCKLEYQLKINSDLSLRLRQLEGILREAMNNHSLEMKKIIENSERGLSELEDKVNHLEDENQILCSSIITYQNRISEMNKEYFLMLINK